MCPIKNKSFREFEWKSAFFDLLVRLPSAFQFPLSTTHSCPSAAMGTVTARVLDCKHPICRQLFQLWCPIKYFNYSEYSEVGQSLPLFWDRRRRRCLWCMWHFTVGIGWRSFGDIIVVVLDWILLFWLTGHIDLVTRLLLFDTHGSRTRGRSCLSPPGRLGCL